VADFYFQWHLTQRCNFRCQHCYQTGAVGAEMDWAGLKAGADKIGATLSQWKRQGHIALTGGEPLLRPECLDLMDYLGGLGAVESVDLLTNGSLVTDETLARLSRSPKRGRVQVSLDGGSAATHDAVRGPGAFDQALGAIRRLVRAGIPVRVMFTLHRGNVEDLPGLVELGVREGIEGLVVDRLVPMGRGAKLQSLLLEPPELRRTYEYLFMRSEELANAGSSLHIVKLRTLWALIAPDRMSREEDLPLQRQVGAMCSAGAGQLCILEEGSVLPCRRLPITLGNLARDSLFSMFYTAPFLWRLRDRSSIKGRCRTCEYASRCGGCRAMAYALTGDPLEEDPQCWKHASLN